MSSNPGTRFYTVNYLHLGPIKLYCCLNKTKKEKWDKGPSEKTVFSFPNNPLSLGKSHPASTISHRWV